MGIEEIVAHVHSKTGVPRTTVKRLLRELLSTIRLNIRDNVIQIRGFGTFYSKEFPYTNPRTHQKEKTKRVYFRPSWKMKEVANDSKS
jgi:nucleoid DNA-binding protein